MTVINTNVKSLVAQEANRSIGLSQAVSMQRLSTGLRINSAKDDAAGLSIGTRMDAQVRGLNMAIRNANDGISLMQTAEGSLQEVTNSLQRMRELSVQASNGINNSQDRAALDKEVQQLKQEIDRIATKTQFNNVNILDGSYKNKNIQIGDKADQTMRVDIASAKVADLGLGNGGAGNILIGTRIDNSAQGGDTTGATISADFEDGTTKLLINGTQIGPIKDTTSGSESTDTTTDINDVVVAINNADAGVKASAFNEVVAKTKGSGVTDDGNFVITVRSNDSGQDVAITVGNTKSMQEMVDQINASGSEKLVQAKLNDDGKLVLFNTSGAKISVEDASAATDYVGGSGFATASTEYYGMLRLESTNGQPVTVGTNWRDNVGGTRGGEATALLTLGLQATSMVTTGVEKSNGPVVIGAAVANADIVTEWQNGEIKINGVNIWRAGQDTTGINYDSLAVGGDVPANTKEDYAWTSKVSLINSFSDQTGVHAEKFTNEDGLFSLKLTSNNNTPIQIELGDMNGSNDNLSAYATLGGYATHGLIEQNVGASDFDTNAATMGTAAGGASMSGMNILTESSALSSIKTIDNALEKVNDMRADLGAKQNRLASTVSNLSNVVTNTEASKSRIMDTDYGKETTNLARAQIISQAATAMLAQANQSAQSVLSLLK
jgi:flagellin